MSRDVKHWYAVYTKPRWEKKVHTLLQERGLESYCPLNKVHRQWSDRVKLVEEPLFKSYVFVHITDEQQSGVRLINGIVNFVYWLGRPAVIPANDISRIRRFLKDYEQVIAEPLPLKADDKVIIHSGILMDRVAKVKRVYGNTVEVVIDSLGYKLVANVKRKDVNVVRK
ncbi:MAG: UpxY family transcription antiterminator [Bacteroidetes bacterium]|nr:UpxY family transcription antiterminator [Bacteroidota bacterium]